MIGIIFIFLFLFPPIAFFLLLNSNIFESRENPITEAVQQLAKRITELENINRKDQDQDQDQDQDKDKDLLPHN